MVVDAGHAVSERTDQLVGRRRSRRLGHFNPRFTYNDNSVEAVWYVDTTIEATIAGGDSSKRVNLYLNVSNLFDQAPPFGFGFQNGPYDRIGRTYKAGVRFRF